LKVMSSESYSKHGYSPSCIIFDELHAQPNRNLWDVMTFGSDSARRQQAVIVLTTAGNDPDRHSIGWEIHETCRRILAVRAGTPERELDEDDPDWCPIMYGVSILTGDDPDKIAALDIYDEALWALCNPALGISVQLRTLRREAAAAKKSDGAERLFRWLRLNQWISTDAVSWISVTLYDKTQWHGDVESLLGKTCYGGVDLSATTDLTSFSLVFPPQEGLETWVELVWGWVPTDDLEGREQRDHVPFRDWIRAGFLRGCPGSVIDYEDVIDTIYAAAEQYEIKLIGFDPWLSRTITQRLEAGDPAQRRGRLPVAEIPQDMKTLAPITKLLRELILKHEMLHVHNTAARWCFNNVRCCEDINGNQKPNKKKSTGRIDMTMAWIIALATAVADTENGPGYDTENLGEDWGI
ncbi:MAG: terminase TerL endonuclease subunit, partial [Pseudoflavonifractor sp.]